MKQPLLGLNVLTSIYICIYIYIYVVVVYASNAFSFFLRFQNQGLNEGLRLRLG